MTEQPVGPHCGNNPNTRLTDGDRQAVEEFRAYLTGRPHPDPSASSAAALRRVRAVLETEHVAGRTALEYRGLITAALMGPTATDQAAEPLCVCGHPMRLHHEDICLTECGCNDGREPESATDLPGRLADALTARFTQQGNLHAGMRRHEQGPDGWPASHPVGPRDVAEVLRELLATALLPAPADRAAVLEAEVEQLAEASRRLLEQRQEMAEERFVWQERGDRAEARVRELEAGAAVLTAAERTMLTYALDQAQERIWSEGGFTDEDQAAVTSLRRMADEATAEHHTVDGVRHLCHTGDHYCPDADGPSRMADETQQPETQAAEAHPAEHSWAAELYDPLADEWVAGTRYIARDRAVNTLNHAKRLGPVWKDGTPVVRRLVRATTTYTVEQPAAVQQPKEA